MGFGADILDIMHNIFLFFGINFNSFTEQIIVSIGLFILFIIIGWIIYHIIEKYFTKWASKTKTNLDDEILKNIKKPIYFLVIIIGLYSALEVISVLNAYRDIISFIFVILEILLITFIITRVVNVVIAWYGQRKSKQKMSEHILFVLKRMINAIIYIFAFLIILYALKIDLSGIIVGLGVGGIAIAFALQEVLSDMFSAFSIYFDKPFEIGDYIIAGGYSGTVKKIGMKSTRIQLLQGEELIMSNKELTSGSVRNFKKMKKRRISFSFGVTYDTSSEKLRKIPDIIRDIIDNKKIQYVDRLDRVNFTEFGDFSLNFEIVYYIKTKDYNIYCETQEIINIAIKEAFEKEEIEMAFPTQTILLNKK